MKPPRVLGMVGLDGGMVASVERCDGSVLICPVIVAKDGTLGVQPPRGEWLHDPPPQPLKGQEVLADAGEAP